MTKIIDSLSVFFPAYNEELNIQTTVRKAEEILAKIAETWEILIVNDGSKDKTEEICLKLQEQDQRIRLINHERNRGYGASLKSGFYNARYPWIAFTDADGQFDFSEINKFIEKQSESKADLVIGYYKDRKVSFLTKLTSKIWELVVFILFGLRVKDVDCGFKLVSKRVIENIPHLESEKGAFISSELLIKAKKNGFRIVEIGVSHYPRRLGTSTGRKIDVIIRSLVDLLKLWKKLL